ncbi:pyridoxamine 5'-phosphate oxidase family protein [Parablastomonas sp. CN1-191]|uniref:pyridoxamine 5'-phosphate oxidase family protein n=1 Tax=Parablastomonas sp. CN1-191 TaxID=3400908 RepID=UPI003BF85909
MSKTLKDIADMMKDVDFCMLQTVADNGAIAARPMSNNREVEYDGDAWFFSSEDALSVRHIQTNPNVGLSYQGSAGILGVVGKPGAFIHVEAKAELVRDKAELEKRWQKELERWWPEGPSTPGILLIKAHAGRIHYWDGEDQGEVQL